MSRIVLVVAMARNRAIGRDGGLPWHLSSDLKNFKKLTMGKPLIMGRKTWESLPRRPLPGRPNIVISRNRNYESPGATVVSDGEATLAEAEKSGAEEIAVIGGAEIFALFLAKASRVYLTEIDAEVAGDTFFPPLAPGEWRETSSEWHEAQAGDDAPYRFRILDRVGT